MMAAAAVEMKILIGLLVVTQRGVAVTLVEQTNFKQMVKVKIGIGGGGGGEGGLKHDISGDTHFYAIK